MKKVNPNSGQHVLGVLIIIVGGLFLLNNFDLIPWEVERFIFSWKSLLIGIGVLMLLLGGDKVTALVLIGIGAVFMIPMIFSGIVLSFRYFWPVFIIGAGLIILFKSKSHTRSQTFNSKSAHSSDFFEAVSIFGGSLQNISSPNLKGGKVVAIFGGSDVILKNCQLDGDQAIVEVFVTFGGAKIIVPEDWDVKIEATAMFGAFEDKRHSFPSQFDGNRKTLIIKGAVIFGGGEIKTY